MRPILTGTLVWHSLFVLLVVIAGCGQPSVKGKDELHVEGEVRVRAFEDRLSRTEARLVLLEKLVAKTSESIDGVKAQLAQVAADRNTPKNAMTTLVERVAALEKVQASLISELRQAKGETRGVGVAPIARPPVPGRAERTKERLLEALERGYRKSVLAGLNDETKLRALAQYQFFKKSVEKGKDPRLSLEDVSGMSGDDVSVLRNFFPEFLPVE